MTKKTLSAIVILSITSSLFAQQNVFRFVQDSVTPEEKIKKNEIGLNIAPAIVLLTGGIPSAINYSINYKLLYKNKNAFRFSVNYLANKNIYWNNETNMSENYDLIEHTDSTQIRRYTFHHPEDKIQINLGYEWRRGKKKLKRFFGIDIISGIYQIKKIKRDIAFKLGNTIQQQLSYNTQFPQYVPDDSQLVTTASSEISNFFYVGISPFYGVSYPLSKRFNISAQTGFNLSIDFGNTSYNDYTKNVFRNYSTNLLDIGVRNIINDISLSYRF